MAAETPVEPDGPSRRRALAGGVGAGLVVAAATTGGAVAAIREVRGAGSPVAPAEVIAARDAEQVLISRIDGAVRADPSLRVRLSGIRTDHVAHLAALSAVVAAYPGPAPVVTAPPAGAGRIAEVRAAESSAATTAARRAGRLAGANAVLLASIAACEATHVELLT